MTMQECIIILEHATTLGERTRLLHRWTGSTLLCQLIEPVTFVCCAYSILCPLGPGALSGSKTLERITFLTQKEPVEFCTS